jgi:hypothetical protein
MSPCPACGEVTDPADFRSTDRGVICATCAFKLELEKTRQRTSGSGGVHAVLGDSFMVGLVVGLLCGCFGLAWAYLTKRGPETKKGMALGFAIGTVMGIVGELMRRSGRVPSTGP